MEATHIEKIFRKRVFYLLVSLTALILLVPISTSLGVYNATFIDAIKLLVDAQAVAPDVRAVLLLRFRRVAACIMAGVVLGGAGAAMQSILRNPMASPFTLGISHSAALGVALGLVSGIGGYVSQRVLYLDAYILPLLAIVFSLVQTVIVLFLAYKAGLTERALILSAIAMSFFYQAVLNLVQYLYLNEIQVALVVFWTFGDIGRVGWLDMGVMSVSAALLALYYIYRAIDFDLMNLGDDIAHSSGLNPHRLRVEVALVSAVGTAIVTAFSGVIAFLCLVSPHIARLVTGNSHRYLLPQSMITASILLLAADTLGRVLLSPKTLPAGIMLSLIGAPLLLYLLLRG